MTDTRKQGTVGVHHTRVEWVDTDAAGIYHNTAVVRFVESAEAALMRERGLHDYFQKAPRVRYEVEFDAPLRFGQQVTAVVELIRLGASSMTFSFEVWGEEFEGRPRTLAAHGSYVTVHVADRGHRSSRWPDSWRAALTA
ncbi:acyl-CoA thioesterase [Planotetraspora kaengkrachanensis]|uniref:Acyl-CoA thioester hydrolase n=1 Tax=Planotetraspora kaengkrachanensis TaxID=575193 RepID=A0A8J3LSZ3_9ACTN|nr:thioesterase family protein [Planotetraspora kaengkrachanensis]GIG77602.1 hypothetical protein Pka01_07290 [Planotetraspora kaengkrachanensis]